MTRALDTRHFTLEGIFLKFLEDSELDVLLQKIHKTNGRPEPHISVMIFGNIYKPENVFGFFHNKITSVNF